MIHIIRLNWHDTSILSRKAQALADELGWAIGGKPDPGAFMNYAFPYLDGRDALEGIPYAAYFTHREDCIPGKVGIWKERARNAALRITSAQQYFEDLSEYGPTVKIMPPLDREKFSPAGKLPQRTRPQIGVAGFVYRGGRKGEDLLVEAIQATGDKYEYKAVGQGWPIQTIHLPYDRLQEFYRAIDIYLCTSRIEGIPYPPLEALACGKKIVIPAGVGIMDELPSIPGIERYEAGNVNKMIEAIDRAAETTADPEELREATAIFTFENWAEEHARAFAEYEQVVIATSAKKKTARRPDRGIYIVAHGPSARKCARRLMNSIREFMPETQVAIATDQALPEADYNITGTEGMDPGARKAKLAAYTLAPAAWKQVIYLDADTEITESIEPLFDALTSGWEMVFTKDVTSRCTVPYLRRQKAPDDYQATLDMIGSTEELVLAGGVWAFRRSPGAKRFLQAWQKEWGTGQYRDQPAMLRAYYQAKVRALVLGNEWNSFTNLAHENRASIIKHYSGGTARNEPTVRMRAQATIVNTGKNPVERAGLLFMPGSAVLVDRGRLNFSEIKACQALQITE